MTLSKIAITRPVTTTMFFIAIVLLGCVSFRELPVQLLPDVSLPGAMVFSRYEGLSVPDTVEKMTKPIEGIAAATPRVREINSTSYAGFARTEILFDFGTDMRFATLDLQDKLARFRGTLPRRGVFVFLRAYGTERMQTFFMWITVGGPEDTETLRRIAEDQLGRQLEAIDGVAEVSIGGHAHESVDVIFQRDQLVAHKVGLSRVFSRIRGAAMGKTALGRVRGTREHYSVVLDDMVANEEDLRRLALDDRGIVRLGDVAHVFRNERQSEWISRINGKNFVGLLIRKDADANPLRLAVKVRRTLKEIAATLPPGYSIDIEQDSAKMIEDIIREVRSLAIVGALLAMVVLMLFVRNLRMAAIVFTAIPISVITTFNLMYFAGLSLNIITLIGLALGIGMLVDSAIVVLENIFRHFERTGHAAEASERATGEVWRALLATTLTNVVVFTPILFVEGEMSLLFREGALAIVFPIIVSLSVALTLVPMVTARILAGREKRRAQAGRLRRLFARARASFRRVYPYWPAHLSRPRRLYRELYMMTLRAALRHRVRLILLTALTIFLTGWICLPRINKAAMKHQTEGATFPIFVQVPRGSTREQLLRVLDDVETRLRKLPELEKTRCFGNVEEDAIVYVQLVKQKQRKRTLLEVRESALNVVGEVPGASLSLRPFRVEGRDPAAFSVSYAEGGVVAVRGAHWEELEWVANVMARQLELIPGVARVQVETTRGDPEMQFTLDRERAALFNIQAGDLASYFETSQRRGQFSQITMERGDRNLDVVLRMGELGRNPEADTKEETARPLSEIKSMEVLSPLGGAVPLSEIGHFRKVVGESHLRRYNLQFSLNLMYSIEPRVNRSMVEGALRSLLKEMRLPAGYSAEIVGEEKKIDENTRQLKWMLEITAVLIFMVMASVFESLLSPLVIMLAFPLAAIGVLWGLMLTGAGFEELSMLGVVILAGIVVNNGIVMMDFLSMLRRERGYRRTAAVIMACRARLRPIVMTALTTTLGLVPMALRRDEDINWSGLAIVIISGLSVATLLTLVVIPAMLMNLEDALAFLKRQALKVWNWRWLLYFLRPARMRSKRLELAPAGGPAPFAPTFTIAMTRTAAPETAPPIESQRFSEDIQHSAFSVPRSALSSDRPVGIEIRHVRMIYPVFRPGKILHVVPSSRFKYGARPPEGVEALRNVNLSIGKGMYGLLGPNGAGKSTLLHIITGMIRPTCGFVTVNGLDVAADGRRARAEIGYLPQSFGLYGNFTAREYLAYYSLILGIENRAERARNVAAVLEQVNLLEAADRPVRTFSGGMRQRLGIARLLLTVPRVILVDEPTAGLDPIERVKFRVLLSQLAQDRVILLSTHIIDDISSSCRRLAVLNGGQIVFEGTPAGLVDSARGRIWEVTGRFEDEKRFCERFRLLHKKAAGGDRVLFRFLGETCDLPGAQRATPSLEDAYILATLE